LILDENGVKAIYFKSISVPNPSSLNKEKKENMVKQMGQTKKKHIFNMLSLFFVTALFKPGLNHWLRTFFS
jgi:hypothetical protein